jgi:hypothetical protein
VALLAAALLLLAPGAARAASDPAALSWGVVPGAGDQGSGRANFAYAVEPGAELRDAVVVTNHGQRALDLDVYAADARTTTSGQLDLLPADEPSTGVGTWVTVDLPHVALAPGASVEVPFTVRVPADATPGDHSGGVVTAAVSADDGSTVRLDRRLALRMHLRVAGEVAPALTVDGLTVEHRGTLNPVGAGGVVVRYRVTNTGNARILPAEAVTVAGLAGTRRTVEAVPADEAVEVLPGSSVLREVVLHDVRTLGPLDVEVVAVGTAVGLGGGATARAAADASVLAVPWALAALVLLVVAGTVLPLVVRRRRHRAAARAAGAVSPVAPDSPGVAPAGGAGVAGGIVLPETSRPHDGGHPA